MKRAFLSIVCLFLLLQPLKAQDVDTYQTVFEVNTSLSYVGLIGAKAKLIDSDDFGFYNYNISDYNQFGLKYQLGALASRKISNNFWLRSGGQVYYLKSRAEFEIEETFDNSIENHRNFEEHEIDLVFRGLQIPLLLEYQYDFGKWKAYADLGMTVAFSYTKVNYIRKYNSTFYFIYQYDPICDCFPNGGAYPIPYTNAGSSSNSEQIKQFEAKGLIGFGAILNQANGRAWRIGYAFSADLVPFHRGNNRGERVYERNSEVLETQRHLFHQIEFSMLWPERSIAIKDEGNRSYWKGFFVGGTTTLQLPLKKVRYSGRTGVGWGRNLQIKYISKIGLGARVQLGKWIAPASNYATSSGIQKGELLYQFPFGIELFGGYSHRYEIDVDGGGGKVRAFLLGTGGTIPLNAKMGVALDFTGHITPWEDEEKLLMEAGVGLVLRLF